jgi:hypothetical protein
MTRIKVLSVQTLDSLQDHIAGELSVRLAMIEVDCRPLAVFFGDGDLPLRVVGASFARSGGTVIDVDCSNELGREIMAALKGFKAPPPAVQCRCGYGTSREHDFGFWGGADWMK